MALPFVFLPTVILSQEVTLRNLIESAEVNNGQILSSKLQASSKESQSSAIERSYIPTVDIGASYTQLNPTAGFSPKKTTSGFVIVGLEVFDGGRKRAQLEASRFAHQAALFNSQGIVLGVTLDIINRYYILQQQEAFLVALETKTNELQAQLERLESFMRAGLAMQDEVDRLKAALEDSRYQIEAMKLDIVTSQENLWVKTGIRPTKMSKDSIISPKGISLEPSPQVQQMLALSQELKEQSNMVKASQLPQVVLQNKYSVSNYKDLPDTGFGSDFLVDKQNALSATASMRIFDGGKTAKEKEALHYQHLSLESQKEYLLQEQQSQFLIATKRLETLKSQLKSTQSALKASQSNYESVTGKFEAGIVDYVTYLDALSGTIESEVRHQKAIYDYEIAKALYYYYAGKNPKEYIK